MTRVRIPGIRHEEVGCKIIQMLFLTCIVSECHWKKEQRSPPGCKVFKDKHSSAVV
jgi:hypothetical protein